MERPIQYIRVCTDMFLLCDLICKIEDIGVYNVLPSLFNGRGGGRVARRPSEGGAV